MTNCWPFPVRSSNVCAKYYVGVPWANWNWLHKRKQTSSNGRASPLLMFSETTVVVAGGAFSPPAPLLGPEKKKRLRHPFPPFVAVSSVIPIMSHSSDDWMRPSWLPHFEAIGLNQPAYDFAFSVWAWCISAPIIPHLCLCSLMFAQCRRWAMTENLVLAKIFLAVAARFLRTYPVF